MKTWQIFKRASNLRQRLRPKKTQQQQQQHEASLAKLVWLAKTRQAVTQPLPPKAHPING
jgi:hypothetical protein